jgi:hypothetical protein
MRDHVAIALEHVEKADEWANRDGASLTLEYRDRMVNRELRLAQIHATLAVAEQISELPLPTLA